MKTALVVGCAANVWDDVTRAYRLTEEWDAICCVKSAGVHWEGHFDVWATLHPEMMDKYETERKTLGFPNGYEIIAPPAVELGDHGKKGNVARRISYRWPGMNSSASSGIYGVKVMLDSGYDRVVIAGIPMSTEGGHFLPASKNAHGLIRGDTWKHRDSFIPGFRDTLPFIQGKVKSMSGYTAEVLGTPTPEWLVGNGKLQPSYSSKSGRSAMPADQSAGAENA